MKISTADAFNILDIFENVFLSTSGSYTACYRVVNAPPFSLDGEMLKARFDTNSSAFSHLKNSNGVYFHKQDLYLKKKYDGAEIKGNSFLQIGDREYFIGRPYIEHTCIISFTIGKLESLSTAYIKNPLTYKKELEVKDRKRLDEFADAVNNCIAVLQGNKQMQIEPMCTNEITEYLKGYVNAFNEAGALTDLHFDKVFSYGKNNCAIYSISDEKHIRNKEVPKYIVDESLNGGRAKLETSYMESIGVHMLANHIYNQILFFEGSEKLMNKLNTNIIIHNQNKTFSPQLKYRTESLQKLEKDLALNGAILVKAHFNLMLWDEDNISFEKANELLRKDLTQKGLGFYEPTFEGLRNIFLGSMLGNETTLSRDYYFLTELSVALCFLSHYTVSYQFEKGHVFQDRLYQKPILVDLWQEDKQFMNARNGMYVASTGGGKSVTAANIVQQNIEDGTKTIVVEFGQSFASLIKLYPDKSFHFKYDGTTPLGINPFIVDDHKKVTNDKIRTLAVLVLKFWGVKKVREDDHQVNSVNMVLKNYYKNTISNHSFSDFYSYVEANHNRILSEEKIDTEYFDTKSFLHQCRRFIKGGVYENVTIIGDLEKTITTKDFVVFELTEIKKDPFLMSIVMLILFDTVENKILSDRSVRGEMIFDEYAETAQIRDMLSGEDIHSTVAFCFQKFRKENGAVKIIVQSPSQLPENEFTKSIIANTQLLIVLPTDDVVYNAIVKLFEMENQQQIRLMKSIGRNYRTEHPYNEIFISFSFRMVMVVRLELSPLKFLAYQTDGKAWSWITARHKELLTDDNSMSSMPMETAILEYQKLSK